PPAPVEAASRPLCAARAARPPDSARAPAEPSGVAERAAARAARRIASAILAPGRRIARRPALTVLAGIVVARRAADVVRRRRMPRARLAVLVVGAGGRIVRAVLSRGRGVRTVRAGLGIV